MKTPLFALLFFLMLIVVYYFVHDRAAQNGGACGLEAPRLVPESFTDALTAISCGDKWMILSYVDAASTDMALNFYLSSLKPYNLHEYLFVAATQQTCDVLAKRNLLCYRIGEDGSEKKSLAGGGDEVCDVNVVTNIALKALNNGFTIILTHLDVIFLKNPLPDLKKVLAVNDIATIEDFEHNIGFMIVAPSNSTRSLFAELQRRNAKLTVKCELNSDTLRRVIRDLQIESNAISLAAAILDRNKYLNGLEYFESGSRSLLGKAREECLVVTNDDIDGKESKILRLKEHNMWMVDDGNYYSAENQYYLSYENSVAFKSFRESLVHELRALKFAMFLGKAMERIVILPKFHCLKNKKIRVNLMKNDYVLCSFNKLFQPSNFTEAFTNKYRESSFLSHPTVPIHVKRLKISPYYEFLNEINFNSSNHLYKKSSNASIDARIIRRIDDLELEMFYGDRQYFVLRFRHLYNLEPYFVDPNANSEFLENVKHAFQLLPSTIREDLNKSYAV